MDDLIKIEALENGFEVECLDPKIEEENSKPKSMYRSPYKSYAFSTAAEVLAFVAEKLSKIKPKSKMSEYDSAFKQAAKES